MRLKLKYVKLFSRFAFKFKLRRYTEDISRIHAVTEFLSKCAMFRGWTKGALTRLSLYFSPVEPRRGEVLVKVGRRTCQNPLDSPSTSPKLPLVPALETAV